MTDPSTRASLVRREVVSFARRDGRLSHRHQQAWDAHHAQYVVEPPRSVRSTSIDETWTFDAASVFGRVAPLAVEIGSGDGDAVLAAAQAHPEVDYLAVEVYKPGLARTIVGARSRGLTNLRVLVGDARALLEHGLPEASVSELRVLFPDPWPKARHHKRRLVDGGFARAAARVLVDGGDLRLATDWADYADQMLAVASADADLVNASPEGTWAPRGERVVTRYERKGIDLGRDIRDLHFVRRDR